MPTRDALVSACRREAVTFFLGAGIAHSRGVPLWDDVVRRMAAWVHGEGGESADEELLARARRAVAQELGDEAAERVVLRSHPLEPQLALEWIAAELGKEDVRARVAARLAVPEVTFVSLLRRALYRNVPREPRSDDALGAVAAAVRAEYDRWPERRLTRIVTLNADDLLEREVCADGVERVYPIGRPSKHPRWDHRDQPPPIPLYHVHGYLPEDEADPEGSSHTLVFTDDQFWSTTANPLSFANRVVANALHDTQCLFAGLSMRDVNMMRWLALRFEEVVADARAHGEPERVLRRHFWIHTADDDRSGILREILARRGVSSVELGSWEDHDFGGLLRACFTP